MSRADQRVPLANRGPTNLNESNAWVPALPDFLRFTLPQAHIGLDLEYRQHLDAVQFLLDLCPESGLAVEIERKGGRRGYVHHFQILTPTGESCGDIAWGGERQMGTVSVELTGAACARIAAARPFAEAWGHVRCLLETVGAHITRLDIAHDDYDGVHDLAAAVEMYEAGAFDGAYRRPALNRQGWNDGSGQTVYVGKSTATRQLCVYEKGREQGLRDGDVGVEWVRWEARFNDRNRAVPLDALVEPWAYMVGEYPALCWISACMSVLRVAVKRTKANLAGSVRACRRQFGSLLGLITRNQMDDAMVGKFIRLKLARASLPGWLNANPLGSASLGRAFASPQLAV
ncbi:MAG: replication initiation factor domain-containing protein [Rhodanobacter sp.]